MLTPPLVTMASQSAAASTEHCLERRLVVGDDAEVDVVQPAWATAPTSIVLLLSRIWPGRSGPPSVTSSSPVESTATTGRGVHEDGRWLTLASTPSIAGRTTRAGGEQQVADTTSSPTWRRASPARTAVDADTVVTVDPLGVLHHGDGVGAIGHRRTGHDADRLAAADRHVGGARRPRPHRRRAIRPGHDGVSSARTAYPSTALFSNGGTSSGAQVTRRRHQPSASTSEEGHRRQRPARRHHMRPRPRRSSIIGMTVPARP